MLMEINYFLACDIKAGRVVWRSRAALDDFRKDARKFYVEKHTKVSTFEGPYIYLKTKKKWIVDTS